MSSIRWGNKTPKCPACVAPWCIHVIDAIRHRTDEITVTCHGGKSFWLPTMGRPLDSHTKLPKVGIDLARGEGDYVTIYLPGVVPGDPPEVIGIERHDKIYRRDIMEMVTPYLVTWQLEHPCFCAMLGGDIAAHLDLSIVANIQRTAAMAAYRRELTDPLHSCHLCQIDDLMPDVDTKSSFPKPKPPAPTATTAGSMATAKPAAILYGSKPAPASTFDPDYCPF